MQPIKIAKGVNGQLELYEEKVIIKRKGVLAFMTQGIKGDKDIMINQISSIQFKKGGAFTNGFIQFGFLGGTESKQSLIGATQDENTVMFRQSQNKIFEEIKDYIENKLSRTRDGRQENSGIDDLGKLKKLKDEGIITEEEFEKKKKQILGI